MQFNFYTPAQVRFGWGELKKIGELALPFGRRAFVLIGKNKERAEILLKLLQVNGIKYHVFAVSGEPTVEILENALLSARENLCDMVIGFGGGSVLDTGKAVSALLTNSGAMMDYLEVVGKGMAIESPSLPYIAIPTTAGTGTEVTSNAVLGVPEKGVKVSMRSPYMIPNVAIVDPELTVSVNPEVTAASGLDALTQVLEAFVSVKANDMVDLLAREGMHRASRSLRSAYRDGNDQEARSDMSFTALLSGMALANAGLGAVHGFAGPLGGMISASHGAICACLLPHVMEMNIRVLEEQNPHSVYLKRYDEVAQILTGDRSANRFHGVDWVKELCGDLNIPTLKQLGYSPVQAEELIDKSKNSSSMKGNPVKLSGEQMLRILQNAY
ncbi:MAG: iron-containing alcohol dehydrogenase [Marinifilaceae bacterium]